MVKRVFTTRQPCYNVGTWLWYPSWWTRRASRDHIDTVSSIHDVLGEQHMRGWKHRRTRLRADEQTETSFVSHTFLRDVAAFCMSVSWVLPVLLCPVYAGVLGTVPIRTYDVVLRWCTDGRRSNTTQNMRGETYYLLVLIVSFSHACTYVRTGTYIFLSGASVHAHTEQQTTSRTSLEGIRFLSNYSSLNYTSRPIATS